MAAQKNGKAAVPAKGAGVKGDPALKALEAAKAKFAEAQKKLQEKRKEVSAATRLIATGDKKIATLEKKIEETKDAPSKATEMLLKKAEEMEAKAAEMEAKQEETLKDAGAIEERLKAKEEELAKVKEASDKKLEELGVPKTSVRIAATGSAAGRRQKNNFQYRLKRKDWEMKYNLKGRIESAEKYGLTIVFNSEDYVLTGGTIDGEFKHAYGEGALTSLGTVIKDHGENVEEK